MTDDVYIDPQLLIPAKSVSRAGISTSNTQLALRTARTVSNGKFGDKFESSGPVTELQYRVLTEKSGDAKEKISLTHRDSGRHNVLTSSPRIGVMTDFKHQMSYKPTVVSGAVLDRPSSSPNERPMSKQELRRGLIRPRTADESERPSSWALGAQRWRKNKDEDLPAVGHYKPRDAIMYPRPRSAALGRPASSSSGSKREIRSVTPSKQRSVEFVNTAAFHERSVEMPTRDFDFTRSGSVSEINDSGEMRRSPSPDMMRPQTAPAIVEPPRPQSAAFKSALPQRPPSRPAATDMFYDAKHDFIAQRTNRGPVMEKMTARKAIVTTMFGHSYRIKESLVTKRPLSVPNMDRQLARDDVVMTKPKVFHPSKWPINEAPVLPRPKSADIAKVLTREQRNRWGREPRLSFVEPKYGPYVVKEEIVTPHVPQVTIATQLTREARDRPERAALAAAKSSAGERAYDIERADAILYPRAIVPNFAQSISHDDPVIGRESGVKFLDRQYNLDHKSPTRGVEMDKVLSRDDRDRKYRMGGVTDLTYHPKYELMSARPTHVMAMALVTGRDPVKVKRRTKPNTNGLPANVFALVDALDEKKQAKLKVAETKPVVVAPFSKQVGRATSVPTRTPHPKLMDVYYDVKDDIVNAKPVAHWFDSPSRVATVK